MWESEPQTILFIKNKFKKSYSIEDLNLKVIYTNRGNFIKIPGEGRTIIF